MSMEISDVYAATDLPGDIKGIVADLSRFKNDQCIKIQSWDHENDELLWFPSWALNIVPWEYMLTKH